MSFLVKAIHFFNVIFEANVPIGNNSKFATFANFCKLVSQTRMRQTLQLAMKLSSFLILAFLFAACSSDDPIITSNSARKDLLERLPDKGLIRFDNPEVGQRSRYVSFQASKDVATDEVTFIYKPDTLVLIITQKESDKWVVREFLTEGSENDFLQDEVVIRHLSVDSDSAYFSRPSSAFSVSLVFIGDRMNIPLQPVSEPAPLNPDCMPLFGYETKVWMQYTTNYSQFGQTFHHLNDFYDYSEMAGDGLGLMYAYGPSYGLVRWTWVSAWEQDKAEGWDLLPE